MENTEKKMIRTVKTRMAEGLDQVETELTLDFTSLSVDDVYEIAAQAAVIKWQGNARRGKEIPTVATYKVPKPGTKSDGTASREAAIRRLLGEKADFFLKKYGVEEAWKRCAAMIRTLAIDDEEGGE